MKYEELKPHVGHSIQVIEENRGLKYIVLRCSCGDELLLEHRPLVALTAVGFTWECPECGQDNRVDGAPDDVTCSFCAAEYGVDAVLK